MGVTRLSDGTTVILKKSLKTREEGRLTQHFCTPERASAADNHCVPIYEIIRDADPDFEFLVLPLLRPFDDPPFENVGQALDFVKQTLEARSLVGLV